MRKTKAFTLIELLVVISIIALLIGILLPALGAARRTARQMQNSTQVRSIHAASLVFAQSNKGYYPGRRSDGTQEDVPLDPDMNGTYDSVAGLWIEGRYCVLLKGEYLPPQMLISPVEDKKPVVLPWHTTLSNYSYAMLTCLPTDDPDTSRNAEWRETSSAEAVAISDRAIKLGSVDGDLAQAKSIHTNPATSTEWRGSVAWNDNHVTFEPDFTVATRYGNTRTSDDVLFAENDAVDHGDAVMCYENNGIDLATATID